MSTIPNQDPNVITVAGAVTPKRLNHINAAGVLALTLALPTVDGQMATFTDETGHAHTITMPSVGSPPTAGLNIAKTILTFNGTAGSSVELISRNGSWFTGPLTGVTIS